MLAHTTIVLRCTVKAFPSPTDFWFFNQQGDQNTPIQVTQFDNVLPSRRRFPDNVSFYNLTLTITDIKPEQSGVYHCQASNEAGKTEDVIQVYGNAIK